MSALYIFPLSQLLLLPQSGIALEPGTHDMSAICIRKSATCCVRITHRSAQHTGKWQGC